MGEVRKYSGPEYFGPEYFGLQSVWSGERGGEEKGKRGLFWGESGERRGKRGY